MKQNQNFGNENGNAIENGNENNGQLVGNPPQNVGNQGVGNFNLDWGRGGEELTWEKLIGLDGSLFFLEHVFWIVSLNTLFILVFGMVACCRYFRSLSLVCSILSVSHRPFHNCGLQTDEAHILDEGRRSCHYDYRLCYYRFWVARVAPDAAICEVQMLGEVSF